MTGVTNNAVAEAPGTIGEMEDTGGKHDNGAHPFGIAMQSTAKPYGLEPALCNSSVISAEFWAVMTFGEKPSSSTVTSNLALPPMIPS